MNTPAGGKKIAATLRAKYGPHYFSEIGVKGGRNGRRKGYAVRPELAREGQRLSVEAKQRNKLTNLTEST